jgi:hypothetical protein
MSQWPTIIIEGGSSMTTTATSPIDGKPIEHPDEVRKAFHHAFRLFYAHLIIDRAENPSTLSEQNNCAMCQGANVYHHCMFDKCLSQDHTDECLHMRPEEKNAYEELRYRYRTKFNEARFWLLQGATKLPRVGDAPFIQLDPDFFKRFRNNN